MLQTHTHTKQTHPYNTHTQKKGVRRTPKNTNKGGVEDSGSQGSDFEENWCTRHSVLRRIRLHMPPGPKQIKKSSKLSEKNQNPLTHPI